MRALWGLGLMLVAGCATAGDMAAKPAKASFTSERARADLAACLSSELSYLGGPSQVPAPEGQTRITFTFGNRIFSDVTLTDGPPQRVDLRGVSGGRVIGKVKNCL